MIYGLLTGRGGSKGIKNKNIYPLLGRPLTVYPMLAANNSKHIKKTYLTTDSKEIAEVAEKHGAETIWRPEHLASDESLHQDAIVHGYEYMVNELGLDVQIVVILLCNSVTIKPGIIDEGIEKLLADESLDSCVTVSEYNEYNPARAMKIEDDRLKSVVDPEFFKGLTCDRHSAGATYFCDGGAWICRARCMDLSYGNAPYRWLGKNVHPLIQSGGLDIDNERGLAVAEYWLKRHGFTETTTPYDQV